MRPVYLALCLIGCTDLIVEPTEGGGGADPTAGAAPEGGTDAVAGGSGGVGGSGGTGGEGGQPTARSIVVDIEIPSGTDADQVVVMVSAPDGTMRSTWLGGDLPVEAGVNDGDLVWYLYNAGFSYADTFRVTPEVTEVKTDVWLRKVEEPCELETMTMLIDIPEVDDANAYSIKLAGADYLPVGPLVPGTTHEAEVRACPTTDSFDVLLLAQEYANSDPIVFARMDSIPFVPASTVSVPVVWRDERELVDIVVEADPGTAFGIHGHWIGNGFGRFGYPVTTTLNGTVGESGTTTSSYGPFALGSGTASVSVNVPQGFFSCELDTSWKMAPFDDEPLRVRIGALAGFAPLPDGHVALAANGEIGDVMLWTLDSYASNHQAYWRIHEDPRAPYPMPVHPDVPEDLIPDYYWPGGGAELRYIHQDDEALTGYAAYARSHRPETSGRARHRVPTGC